jgi:hypothetical protein
MLGWVYRALLASLGIVLTFALAWPATQHLRVEAATSLAEVEFSLGPPIVWSVGGGRLLEHGQLATPTTERTNKEPQTQALDGAKIGDEAQVDFAAIKDANKCVHTIRAKLSLHGDELVVELERLVKPDAGTKQEMGQCSQVETALAVLENGDGTRRAIKLPAQLRLAQSEFRDGLTLEFRGDLRIGNDVSSSRQPLLKSGSLALWDLRREWPGVLQSVRPRIVDAQYETDKRELGLGDKVWITGSASSDNSAEMPQGFVRVIKGDSSTEMSVYAATIASLARVVHPFRQPEEPKAHWMKRLWADELLTKVAALIGGLVGIFGNPFSIAKPEDKAEPASSPLRWKLRRRKKSTVGFPR